MRICSVEPRVRWPHHFDQGWYFVRYRDGGITFLMSRKSCKAYAAIFGGTVHRHSQAPNWWARMSCLMIMVGAMGVIISTMMFGNDHAATNSSVVIMVSGLISAGLFLAVDLIKTELLQKYFRQG